MRERGVKLGRVESGRAESGRGGREVGTGAASGGWNDAARRRGARNRAEEDGKDAARRSGSVSISCLATTGAC